MKDDTKFNFAWDLNEALCEIIADGADESRVIAAKAAAHPKLKRWLEPEPAAWRWSVYGVWHYATYQGYPMAGDAELLYLSPSKG